MRITSCSLVLAAAAAYASFNSPTAEAALFIPLQNWSLSLNNIPGDNNLQVDGIDRVGYTGSVNHVVISKQAGGTPGVIEIGDTARIEGVIRVDTFLDDDGIGGPIPVLGLNGLGGPADDFWELTAKFATTVSITSVSATVFTYIHDPAADLLNPSFLNLYLDEYGDAAGGDKSSTITGLGYDDGTLFASFVDTFEPTIINAQPLTPDSSGADVAIFEFVSGLAGVIYDQGGTDLILNNLLQQLRSAETIFPPGSVNAPTQWASAGGPFPGSNVTVNPPFNFFASGNGEAAIAAAAVPEPSSLLLGAAGAAALAAYGWRRRKSAHLAAAV